MLCKTQLKPAKISLKLTIFGLFLVTFQGIFAQENLISLSEKESYFPLAAEGSISRLYVDPEDHEGVLKTAEIFQKDLERITDKRPELIKNRSISGDFPVIIGTIGKNQMIDELIASGKLQLENLEGSWERYSIQVVKDPFPEVSQALVIAGSDKRGTIYGMYEFSKQAGVSPWYWWADVPVKKSSSLYVNPEPFTQESPKVKYRGIFINDEAPALSGWIAENFGDFNHEFYEHVFELILRLKGNFLWPAMWGRAFYDDDPKNAELADLYGVVIGTSHHEPLMRAHDEWRRYGEGEWNYNTNAENLQKFWREGMERMGDNESLVTVGMRGDGDEPMSEGTAIELLENIVKDQREIIADVTDKPAEETPQVWALYKEVQDYYDQGMRVPDDVTLLLADDNWGNIRKLPNPEEAERDGGYGIYYHFDYVGGPRNYKWINTTQISRVWEQMNLAYTYGADRLWIVNVGDIKPMEFPISFFLDYAWDPEKIGIEELEKYTQDWAKAQFGYEKAVEIADVLQKYTKYNSRRKPELISPETYSLAHYNEAETILKEWKDLEQKAKQVGDELEEKYQDAYYELVLFPVEASANLNRLYIAAAKNKLYAEQGRAVANKYADSVKIFFEKDSILTKTYNQEPADGKWNHMMDQTHIGYTYWQQPDQNNMPEVTYIEVPEKAEVGLALEGTTQSWPDAHKEAKLNIYKEKPTYNLEVFNKGSKSFDYRIKNDHKWLKIDQNSGKISDQKRIQIRVNWDEVPEDLEEASISLEANGETIPINLALKNYQEYISLDAASFVANNKVSGAGWEIIPNLGKTGDAVSPLSEKPTQWKLEDSPQLRYNFKTERTGEFQFTFYLSPTLDFKDQDGLQFAYSLDDQEPKKLNLQSDTKDSWDDSVANNVTKISTNLRIDTKGQHQLYLYAIDQGIVVQKIFISLDKLKPSYLGPPANSK